MSVTTSPPAFADPLADDVLPPPSFTPTSETVIPGAPARQGSLTRDRAALLAPDVEGQTGTDAIELVRSSGLIAAIETVESAEDSQQGLVIEQDPPPGTQMAPRRRPDAPSRPGAGRAARRARRCPYRGPGDAESSPAASDEYEDDTEQWFATLGPSFPRRPVARVGPRKATPETPQAPPRAHPGNRGQISTGAADQSPLALTAATRSPAAAPLEDDLPDPLPSAWDSPTKELPNLHREPAPPGHLTSLIAAVLVRLPDRSVMPTWRRRALVYRRRSPRLAPRDASRRLASHTTPLGTARPAPVSRRAGWLRSRGRGPCA